MTPASPGVAPARAPLGSARETRSQLWEQRPDRPLLVSLYAGLWGLLGAPARRWLARTALASLPGCVAGAGAALLALRFFAAAPPGPPLLLAGGALGAALLGTGLRRARRAHSGRAVSARELLELGALALVAAGAAAQLSERLTLGPGAPLEPVGWLVLAALVVLAPRGVGLALVALALALQAGPWVVAGARLEALPGVAVRGGFALAFALLHHLVLGARVAAGRRAEQAALARRRRELDAQARRLRLLAAASGPEDEGPEERAVRLTDASVLESDAAARGLLAVAEVALRAHTVAAYLLSDDDASLVRWECRSPSDRVAARLSAGEGPLGGVVKRRTPLRLQGEVNAANHYDDGARPRALLVVPLYARLGGHLRGVVLADRMEATPFTEDDERLLSALATELARAAAAERLLRDGRARREETERFHGALERLNRTAKPREVFDALLDAAAEMVPVDFGAITLCDEVDGRTLHRVARAALGAPRAGAPAAAELEGRTFPDNGGLVACAVRLGAPLPGRDLSLTDAVVFDEESRLKGLASMKVVPLRAGEHVLGTLVLGARRTGAYPADAVRQLEIVAMQAADSVQRARLFDETERLATTDGLTGLVNHRTFQARLDDHLAQALRYGKKLSLLLTDIDHFKAVNDTYGHPVGDLVLKGVARLLQSEARTTDVAARYGGEEFVLVMPETDAAGAHRMAERIRVKVAAATFRCEQGELRVTLSIGIATFPSDGRRKAELVELADAGLYHAKRHGRNQTVALGAARAGARDCGVKCR